MYESARVDMITNQADKRKICEVMKSCRKARNRFRDPLVDRSISILHKIKDLKEKLQALLLNTSNNMDETGR